MPTRSPTSRSLPAAAKKTAKAPSTPAPAAKPVKETANAAPAKASNAKPAKAPARAPAKKASPVKPTAPAKPPSRPAAKKATPKPPPKVAEPAPKPAAKAPSRPARPTVPVPTAKPLPASKPVPPPAKVANLRVEAAIPSEKDLSAKAKGGSATVKDKIVLAAPDAYWLHVMWELSVQSVQRAEAALGQDWHGAQPIIRLFDVTSTDTTSTSETPVKDIAVHGGCSHWYIDIAQPPRAYRADIGYMPRRGRFFELARSNVLTPPAAGASEPIDDAKGDPAARGLPVGDHHHGGKDLGDEQFRRPMKENMFGTGALPPGKLKKFFFDIDAELVVYGRTDPGATVTMHNEPVKLRSDGSGTFSMRFSLPDCRQIIPAVATSADGMEEQTIVLAIERNTKRLDPMVHDLYGE